MKWNLYSELLVIRFIIFSFTIIHFELFELEIKHTCFERNAHSTFSPCFPTILFIENLDSLEFGHYYLMLSSFSIKLFLYFFIPFSTRFVPSKWMQPKNISTLPIRSRIVVTLRNDECSFIDNYLIYWMLQIRSYVLQKWGKQLRMENSITNYYCTSHKCSYCWNKNHPAFVSL